MAVNNTPWQQSHTLICSSLPGREPRLVSTEKDVTHSKATHTREIVLEAKALAAEAGIRYADALEIITGIPSLLKSQAM